MASTAQIYADSRTRISELLTGLSAEEAARPVPTCPEWTVHDVLAHVVGICADVLGGNVAGVTTDPWTAAQVEARRDRTVGELLAEWAETAPQVEAFADHFPGRVGEQWIADLTTHEHDIRGALDRAGARDSAALDAALDFFVEVGLASSVGSRGLGPLAVRADGKSWVVGTGEVVDIDMETVVATAGPAVASTDPPPPPVVTLDAPPFELFRALSGRRSAVQIAAFDWTGDPEPYVAAFTYGPFTVSPVDIVE